jgi:peptidoglycan hydrolase-like protein with peptidoglycan-binding domain
MERAVFLQDVPFAYSDDYDGALKNSLENIAHQLQRDLSRNERENNYITDDTARTLHTAVSELDRCGISTGISDSSIGRLAWFVGGDAAKIRQMQRNLNNLGVGQRLEEDGVYGEKTKEAIDNLITKISSYLSDPQKMRLLDQAVGAIVSALDFASGPHNSSVRRVYDALEKSRQELQRVVWKLGAEYYLRARGYNVAALLLEHSLESSPSNLYFGQTHWVTQKIMQSNGFQKSYADLEQNIQSNPEQYAVSGKMDMNFQTTGDTDLFYGIGKCTIYYTCKRRSSTVQIEFTVEDEYDFDRIRSISGDVERVVRFNFSLGNLANDAGLFSQADGVISPYRISANFEKSIEMKGVYL